MKNKVLFVVCLLFGLLFINSGLNKFFNYMPMPEQMPPQMMKFMGAFMEMKWLLPLVAVVEIIGGILFIPARTRALGAIMLLPIMVGIVLTHVMIEQSGLILSLVLSAINIWVILENSHKYMPMLKA